MALASEVVRSLHEAARRGDADGKRLLDTLQTVASRYLRKCGKADLAEIDAERRPLVRERHVVEELTIVASRPVALEGLVDAWFRVLRDGEKDGRRTAEACIHKLRRAPHYQELASVLPELESAGSEALKKIAGHYGAARDDVGRKRRELLCPKCAPGEGGLSRDGQVRYTEPVPGDVKGWGCAGGSCGPRSAMKVLEFVHERARDQVGDMLVVLGYPASKVRNLFDYERAAWDRSVGKRKRGATPQGTSPG